VAEERLLVVAVRIVGQEAVDTAEGDVEITSPTLLAMEIFVTPENEGQDGSVLVFASGGTPPYSILIDGVPITGSIASNLASGSYVVEIVDANGCTQNAEVFVDNVNDVLLGNQNFIEVYPNPFTDQISIDVGSTYIENWELHDATGKKILSGGPHTAGPLRLNPEVEKGIFFLHIITHNGSRVLRIVKV